MSKKYELTQKQYVEYKLLRKFCSDVTKKFGPVKRSVMNVKLIAFNGLKDSNADKDWIVLNTEKVFELGNDFDCLADVVENFPSLIDDSKLDI